MIGLLLISGGDRALPEPPHLDDRSGLQPDDLQRRVGRQHARWSRLIIAAHRHPVRAALHDRRLLHLPGQDRRRHRRLLGRRRLAIVDAMRVARRRARRPRRGCSPTRPACGACSGWRSPAGSWRPSAVVAAYLTLSVVVAAVFLGGETLDGGRADPGGVAAARRSSAAPLLFGVDLLAQACRAAAQGPAAGGPDGAPLRARPGLDEPRAERRAGRRHRRRARRARRVRDLVPAGAGAGGRRAAPRPRRRSSSSIRRRRSSCCSPDRSCVLLLALIGGRTRAITRAPVRRGPLAERVLPRHAPRAADAQDVRAEPGAGRQHPRHQPPVRRDHDGRAADAPSRPSLVLEWGGAVAVALVAVEVSLRLMAGAIEFERALAVLIIVPEFFLPLRDARHALSRGGGRADGRRAGLRGPRRAGAGVPRRRPTGHAAGPGRRGPGRARHRLRRGDRHLSGTDDAALDRFDLVDPGPRGRLALVGRDRRRQVDRSPTSCFGSSSRTTGSILVGGVAARDRSTWRAWRAHVAWVPQRPYLFHGSVADNIRLARPDATDEELREAAREAGRRHVHRRAAARLRRRRSARTGPGSAAASASGSRSLGAFLAGARLVVLDEATSHLDAAERGAASATRVERLGRATGRCSSCRIDCAWCSIADVVAVIDRGRVVESGAPAELAAGGTAPYRAARSAGRRRRRGEPLMTHVPAGSLGLMAGAAALDRDRGAARVPGGRVRTSR